MALASTDVTAVVNLHREADGATPTIVSAWRAVEHARAAGIQTKLVLVLDNADRATVDVANGWVTRGVQILPIDVKDLGAARNAAVRAARSDWVAFLDGDDLWGESWLSRAFASANSAGCDATFDVWHPEVNVMFGGAHSLLHHIESSDPDFSFARLRLHNAWTALSFVRRDHVEALPYPRNRLSEGFGYEDWSWNLEVLRRGGRHRVVPDTVHAIYRSPEGGRSSNLLEQSRHALRAPYPAPTPDIHDVPGQAETLSDLTTVAPDLPPQYTRQPVNLSAAIHSDLRAAANIAPRVADTIRGPLQPKSLPQNTNRHVTAEQRALEEIHLAQTASPDATAAELLERCAEVLRLSDDGRLRVVTEVLLDPLHRVKQLGESSLIDAALAQHPQLAEVVGNP